MRFRSPARFFRDLSVVLLALGTVTACARNPATGERQLSFIGEREEIRMGRQADESIVQSMGLYGDEDLQSYVAEMGREMAAVSERPGLPWTFRVVDEPMVNAFAVPGGFIYMTRGILAHFNSGAQLAAVVGHEIGHVTARHSVNQISRQQLAGLGLGIGSILSPEVAQFQGLISAGLQLAFLRFSRDDEREADDLGLRYMTAVGYDPTEMPGVFRMLARASGGGGGRAPGWLSTHPDPEDREERIERRLSEMQPEPGGLTVDRERYLRSLDGLVFDDDPRNGYFRDSTFLHPVLRFRIDLPGGWQMVNQARAVVAQPEDGSAVVVLTLADEADRDQALRAFLGQEGVEAGDTARRAINGHEASWSRFRVRTQETVLAGTVAFVEYDGRVYQLLGYTSESRYGAHRETFEDSFRSFDELADPDLLNVAPKRLEIVELPRAMTLAEFDEQYPSTVPLERITFINQTDADERMEAGRLVKRVVGEGAPGSE